MAASGGEAEGEVVEEKPDADQVIRKHLGIVRYSDLVVGAGAEMDASFTRLGATLEKRFQRKREDGAVLVDQNLKEISRLAFFNALVREITFPTLDAGSSDPASLTVTIAPEYARTIKGSGAKLPRRRRSRRNGSRRTSAADRRRRLQEGEQDRGAGRSSRRSKRRSGSFATTCRSRRASRSATS